MDKLRRSLGCLAPIAVAALLGVAATAWAQDGAGPAVLGADPLVGALLELVRGGGLPAVLALIAWWARGISQTGVVLTVRLHPDDRALLQGMERE